MRYPKRIAYLLISRALVLGVIAISMFKFDVGVNEMLNNVSIGAICLLGFVTVVFFLITQFVGVVHAVQTPPKEIEYFMSREFRITTWILIALGIIVTILTAAFASYVTSLVVLLYTLSMSRWNSYVDKVDVASKEEMMKSLRKTA